MDVPRRPRRRSIDRKMVALLVHAIKVALNSSTYTHPPEDRMPIGIERLTILVPCHSASDMTDIYLT